LINNLGGANFLRVRVGIGRPELRHSVEEYVLQMFTSEQLQTLPRTLSVVAGVIESVITAGAEATMNQWHQEQPDI
jgi:PTH1 family peptidyl-tRNA hydrolase